MRSNKRFSNATFTKRVDHYGGEHRGPRAIAEAAVCERCGAVRAGRRWTKSPASRPDAPAASVVARPVVCPACRQASSGEQRGVVTLEGRFLAAHRDEVERRIANEAERAAEINPMARILDRQWVGTQRLVVATTTEHLAQRLGRAVERAFGGVTTYDFSHENKFVRVGWYRD